MGLKPECPFTHLTPAGNLSLEAFMIRIVLGLVFAVSALVPAVALACEGAPHQAATPKQVTVGEVAQLTKGKTVLAVDANDASTRKAEGVIPGAILLTSSSQYDVKELPSDKATKLVFYCANQRCGASQGAAERALEAGYVDVAVMPEGIVGWKKAGQPTSRPNS
jgi:rhodanese-related sulfurtransferase